MSRFFIFLSLFLNVFWLSAQIMSDSVSIYGYRSTFFVKEDHYRTLDSSKQTLDTLSWKELPDYLGFFGIQNSYQFLGVLGTATRNLYQPIGPKTIGFHNGWDAYDHLQLNHSDNKFFDSRSPYTRLNYLQGSTGENRLETTFSRAVSQNLQFGLQLNRFTSRKNIGLLGQRTLDKLADHYNFLGYFALKTKNDAYRSMLSFSAMRHWAVEPGGLTHPTDRPLNKDSIIDQFITQPVFFTTNSTRTISELNRIRLYHDFAPTPKRLRFYHTADFSTERNAFYTASFPQLDNSGASYKFFFQNAFFDTLSTNYYLKNRKLDNEIGINYRSQLFYISAFVSRSDFAFEEFQNQDNGPDSSKTGQPSFFSQNAGLKAKVFFSKHFHLQAKATFQLAFQALDQKYRDVFYNRNDFENTLSLVHSNFEIGIANRQTSPTLLQTYIRSNHFIWKNNFKAQQSNSLFTHGSFHLKNRHTLKWDIDFQTFSHLIFFDQNATPQQADKSANLLKAGAFYGLRLWKFHLDNQLIYASTNRKEFIRVPELNWVSKTYFESQLFKKALHLQVGLMANFQSEYLAMAYMPATQTFYLQDHFQCQGVPNLSPFATGKIKNAVLWARVAHLNQRLTNGYFESPNYPALRTSFVFGINWEFFN